MAFVCVIIKSHFILALPVKHIGPSYSSMSYQYPFTYKTPKC